jgi:transmembrane sensor
MTQTTDPIVQAADWLVRLRSDTATPEDDAAFQAWAESDPRNRKAFDTCTLAWEAIGGVRHEEAPDCIEAKARSRRWLLAGGVGAIATAGLTGAGVWLLTAEQVYATDIGDQRRFALRDGSTVMLDACSEVRVSMGADHRRARLIRGRACFTPRYDSKRPFELDLGEGKVVVLSQDIQVSRVGRDTMVVPIVGHAVVKAGDGRTARLDPGQALQANSGLLDVRRASVSDETAWQYGRVVFTNEPLDSAIERMNTYAARPIKLSQTSLSQVQISGAFRIGDSEAFASAVGTILNVTVTNNHDAILIGRSS